MNLKPHAAGAMYVYPLADYQHAEMFTESNQAPSLGSSARSSVRYWEVKETCGPFHQSWKCLW